MMRRLIPAAAALALFAAPAWAQSQPDATPATPAPATGATATPAPTAPAHKPMRRRQTLQQRFDAANTTHDGHLTKDQAAAANWPYVTNNFAAIDKDHKGYVTTSDIRSFAKARRAARQKQQSAPAPAAAPANNG
jgi:hypothetical protein